MEGMTIKTDFDVNDFSDDSAFQFLTSESTCKKYKTECESCDYYKVKCNPDFGVCHKIIKYLR